MQSKKLRLLGLLLSMMILASCETPITGTPSSVKAVPCVSLDYITFDFPGDTPETVRQVREYNAVYDAVCNEDRSSKDNDDNDMGETVSPSADESKDKSSKEKHDNNGFGNGDQDAPGKSGPNNRAENKQS